MSTPNLLHRMIDYYRQIERQEKGRGVHSFDFIYLDYNYKIDWKIYRQIRDAIENYDEEVIVEYL